MDTQTYEVHPAIAQEMGIVAQQAPNQTQPTVVEQESEQTIQQADQAQEVPPQSPSIEELVAQDKHFRAFKEMREARERAERERDELQRRMMEAERVRSQPQEDDLSELFKGNEDDLVEKKHLKKLYERLEKKLEAQYRSTSQTALEAQIRAQFPDFDSVVTQDSVARFSQEMPEMAQSLGAAPDGYNKAVSVYKMIKKMGFSQDSNLEHEKQRIQQNASRPKTATSISAQRTTSNLQHADAFSRGLTPELKKQLHQEMVDAMKNR